MADEAKTTASRRGMLKTVGIMGLGSAISSRFPNLLEPCLYAMDEPPMVADEEKVIPTFCAMCGPGGGCGVNAIVKNGKFIRIESRKDTAINKGTNCAKAHAAPQWVYSPQRLRYPLKRIGQRGEGKFQRITWDEALDAISTKLKEQKEKYGPESLAILSPARRGYSSYLYRFLTVHGSPNYGHSGICAQQKGFSFLYTLGASPSPDIANTNLLVIWGKQPVYAGSSKGGTRQLLDAKARGVKIIAIKPTMEPDVALADIWVPIRPGTDAALALAMLNVVITEKLYDVAFVEKWTHGFDKLVEHIKKYTPQWAEPITGVSATQIREVARLYATTKPACIDHGNGFEHAASCNNAIRSVAILMAITGNLDRKGGDVFGGGGGGRGRGGAGPKQVELPERFTQELVDKNVGPEFPLVFEPMTEGPSTAYYRIFDSVLTGKPYAIRTIIAPGSQPTVSTRGTKNVIEALKKVDFYVTLDITRTSEMDYADIVVPVATAYELDHPFESSGNGLVARNRVIEPLGDYKSDYEFWIELGARMGYGKDFWNGSITECMNDLLKPLGVTYEELRTAPPGPSRESEPPAPAGQGQQYEKYDRVFSNLSTRLSKAPYLPQKKVAIYNTTFEAAGFNPLPEWVEPPESPTATPELLKNYPLIFSDFHTSKVYNAGWLRNVPYLREVMPDPTLQIHPKTAKSRAIQHGDWVIVESPHGSLRLKAEVNPGIREDTVMALHGWWQGCQELGKEDYPRLAGGANTNSMYSTDKKAFDPIVTAMSSQTLVQVRKSTN